MPTFGLLRRRRHRARYLLLAALAAPAFAQSLSAPADPAPATVQPTPQETAAADLPDAPGWSSSQAAQNTPASPAQNSETPAQKTDARDPAAVPPANPSDPRQTKRILGVIPNFRSVSADEHLPPQSVKDKFAAAGHDSFDYGSFILAAVQAGFAINSNSYPEFRKGVLGYGRYYWRTLLDTADENFLVGGVLPAALHQDSRFYTVGHGSIPHRAFYAVTRTLVTRTDSGNETFNASEIIGAGAASGISSTYYPAQYRTWTKVGQKWLTGVLIDGANFTFKEFWPDINSRYLRGHGGGGSGNE